jgi:hypothetical protein
VFLFQLQVFESEELNQPCKWVTCAFIPIMCFCAVVEHEGVKCRYQVSSLGICCNYAFLCCWTWNWMYIASGWPNWGMCFCVLEHEGVEWMLQVMTL